MAVVSQGREPGYPKTSKTLQGQRIVVNHTDRLKIQTDDESEIGENILDQIVGYQIGALFNGGSTPARINDLKLDRSPANRNLWYLDVAASSLTEEEDSQDQPPDQRTPEWAWDFETIERILAKDANGNPVVNSVGEPFELTYPIAIPVLTIERWELTFDPDTILNYVNRTNNAEFWGADQGMALMAGIRDRKDTQEVYEGVYYRKVTYTIKFALPFIADVLEGWKELLLDRGTFYFDEEDQTKKIPFKARGEHVTGNLTNGGFALADGLPPEILRFDKFNSADFSALNLGPY